MPECVLTQNVVVLQQLNDNLVALVSEANAILQVDESLSAPEYLLDKDTTPKRHAAGSVVRASSLQTGGSAATEGIDREMA